MFAKKYNKIIRYSSFGVLLFSLFIVQSPQHVAAACPALDTSRGTDTASVSIATAGTYRIWSRLMAPDTSNNSYVLQIDSTTCGVVVGDSAAIPANTWTWVDYQGGTTTNKINVTLTAGTHTLLLVGRENSVKLDRIILTSDMTCVPTGTGDNCASPPATTVTPPATTPSTGTTTTPTTTTSTPTAPQTSAATTQITASSTPVTVSKGDNIAVAPVVEQGHGSVVKVEYSVDNIVVDTESTAPYVYKFNTAQLSNGPHALGTKVYYADSTSTTTNQKLTISNHKKNISLAALAGAITTIGIISFITWRIIRVRRSKVHVYSDPDITQHIVSSSAPQQTSPMSASQVGNVVNPTVELPKPPTQDNNQY